MNNQQLLWADKKNSILNAMSPEDLERLMRLTTRTIVAKGEFFDAAAEKNNQIHIVDRGYLRICTVTDTGQCIVTGFLGPADLFGTLVPEVPASKDESFIEAVRESRILSIETTLFTTVLEKHPAFMMRLIRYLEDSRQNLIRRVFSLAGKDIYAQTAETLLSLTEKFGEPCSVNPSSGCDMNLTHQELAELVGIARPTLSKVVSEFSKSGFLGKHDSMLCLLDVQQLRNVAEIGKDFRNTNSK